MASPIQALIDLKISSHRSDEEQSASAFAVGIRYQAADITKSGAGIQDMQHGPRSAMVDHNVDLQITTRVADDIAN